MAKATKQSRDLKGIRPKRRLIGINVRKRYYPHNESTVFWWDISIKSVTVRSEEGFSSAMAALRSGRRWASKHGYKSCCMFVKRQSDNGGRVISCKESDPEAEPYVLDADTFSW